MIANTNTGFSVVRTYRHSFNRKFNGDEYLYRSEKLKSFKTQEEAKNYALNERRNLRPRFAETLYVVDNSDNSSIIMLDRTQVINCAK